MTTLTDEYLKLLKNLKKTDLLEFVKVFFANKYRCVVTNFVSAHWGESYVMTILKDDKEFKKFIIITHEENDLRNFIKQNFKTISDCSNEDRVLSKVEGFCLSEVKNAEDLRDEVEFSYNLNLNIYDFNNIKKHIEKNPELRDLLVQSTLSSRPRASKFNQKDKILYDLFTTGKKIADIKNSFISSYIQYFLLENGALSNLELKNHLKDPLPNLPSRAFEDAMLRCLQSKIILLKDSKYELTEAKRKELEEMQSVSSATEACLLQKFKECLDKYGLTDLSKEIFDTIIELYKAQNEKELATLTHKNDVGDITSRKLISKLYESIKLKLKNPKDASNIVKDLLSIVSDSEYLNKMSTTTFFTNLFNSDSLEDFLDIQKRIVFLDTQVALQLLCVEYQDVSYDDSLYQSGKILHQQLRESVDYLELYITSDHVREISNHLYEAYNLKRFINLPYIRDLGPSKNIFYNFYLYLTGYEDDYFTYTYDQYFKELLNTDDDLPNDYYRFVGKVDSLVIDILNYMNIKIQQITQPSNLSILRKEYDMLLGNHPKGNKARENDILCMYYLSDQNNFISPQTGLSDEPYLITLDTTIVSMRKKLIENYQRNFWYIYPPLKFSNRLSVMNLKLNSQNINYEIICMTESNFKSSNEAISMLDIISMFFKNNNINDVKLPRLLAKLKSEEKNCNYLQEYSEKNNNNLPIDVILNEIHKHYRKKGIQALNNISKLFEINELSETIIAYLKQSSTLIQQKNEIDKNIFERFDKLIEDNISNIQ